MMDDETTRIQLEVQRQYVEFLDDTVSFQMSLMSNIVLMSSFETRIVKLVRLTFLE